MTFDDDVGENNIEIYYLCKLMVLKSPILVHNSYLAQLVTNPGAVTVKIPNQELDRRITYFGTEIDIS